MPTVARPRFLSVVAALVAAGALAAADSPVAIKGAGCEDGFRSAGNNPKVQGSIATGWSDNSDWADVKVTYAQETTDVHGGKNAQKITVEKVGSGAVQLVQQIPVKKGRTYGITAWLKSPKPTTVGIFLRQAGQPYAYFGTTQVTANKDWKDFSVYATASQDTDAFVMLVLDAAGEVLVDDVSVSERQ